MGLHEDVGDEPGIEESLPDVTLDELAQLAVLTPYPCENCGESSAFDELIVTGWQDYYMLDLDLDTAICCNCYEEQQAAKIPSDPSLFDCYTPVEIA